jgi:outer membrane protein
VRFCHRGARSRQLVAFPARPGLESVYNLAGGIGAGRDRASDGAPLIALPPNKENSMPAPRLRPTTLALRRRRGLARWRVAALLLVGAAWGGAAQAQSLIELFDAARGYDASYLGARAQAESAQYRAAQADALLRPNVALTAAATHEDAHVPVVGALQTNTAQGALQARHPLFNRANNATIGQAYKALDAAQADLDAAEQDLILRVTQAYFDVLAAQDTLGFTLASKNAITEQLAAAKRNFEVGTATITDTREAQARFDLAVAQQIAAENDLKTKQAALDQLVGRSGVTPQPLATPVQLPASLVGGDVNEWLNRASTQHPAVRKAALALDIARLESDKARAAKLPTVDLVGSLAGGRSVGNGAQPFPGNFTNASVGVQMSMPLYTGGSIQNRLKETTVLEEKSREDLEAARRGVTLATRQTYLGVQSGRAQVKAFEAAESSNQLALEATQLGYKVGVRVNIDVLNAQTQLFQTRRDLARARYDVLVNSLRLRQASGVLAPADLQPINGLLAP